MDLVLHCDCWIFCTAQTQTGMTSCYYSCGQGERDRTSMMMNDHDYCSPNKNLAGPEPSITETPREKRQRKEVHDPEFSHYTSSDYSSSDADSDQESEGVDDDDPNRPWCKCNMPDDGKFMISCDICEYWFHGSCVGVVSALSKRWQKEGKEWYCPDCEEAIENGTPRSAIPRKILKKPKTPKTSDKRRGRPRKTAVQAREASARLSLRSSRKANNSIDSKLSTRRSPTKSTGSESFNEFEHPDRLKELIRERRKAFFLKHRLSEQLKAEKMKEMGVGRRPVTAPLCDSLDSLVSSTNSPTTPADVPKSSNASNTNTTTIKQEPTNKMESVKVTESAPSTSSDPLVLLDSTRDHKNHIFDIGCKICTKQETEDKNEKTNQATDNVVTTKRELESEPDIETEKEKDKEKDKPQDQPKRLRISIDTKLDPSHLSRLREPLVRPTEQGTDSEFNTSRASPNASPNADPAKIDDEPVKSDDEAEEDLYDPETSTLIASSGKNEFELPKAPSNVCWSGTINMQDTGKLNALAKTISGNASFIQGKLSQTLIMCGRIELDRVLGYIKEIKNATRNQILLVQLHPQTENDKFSFDAFFDYLYTRNRGAVIKCPDDAPLKDFYILPIHEKSSIPEVMNPINGPGLDRTVPNCLLGVLIKTKRPPSASGSAISYTPTPINK